MVHQAIHLSRLAVCLVLFIAAGMKTWNLPMFRDAVSEWYIVADPLVPFVVLLVPAVEVAAAIAYIASGGRGIARFWIPCLLATLTFAFVLESAISPDPVPCACFGSMVDSERQPVAFRIIMNLLLCLPFFMGRRASG